MKPCRILLGCMLASLSVLCGGASAQVVTEFSAGITAGGGPFGITAGPDGNLWFTEQGGTIGPITPLGVVTEDAVNARAGGDVGAEGRPGLSSAIIRFAALWWTRPFTPGALSGLW